MPIDPHIEPAIIMPEMTDDELLATLEVRFGQKLQFFFRQRHLSAEAPDLAQETFARVIAKLQGKVRGDEPLRDLSGYVWKTAWLVTHEAYRRQKKERRHAPLETIEPQDRRPDPESRLWHCEMLRVCARALKQLLPSERELILRLVINEEDRQQLCAELGIPLATLRGRLHRALAKLRRLIDEELAT